jgi:hypothetical protein
MASFPVSVKTFATRSAGQTIGSAHVNDLQDEVNAIEDNLVNGLQLVLTARGFTTSTGRLNIGGASTLTTLQAGASTLGTVQAGASTLASLQVGANSTFTGNVTITGSLTVGGVPINASQPSVRVTHSANQNVANGTWTGLNWDTEEVDASAMHSTSANSSRITFADSTGNYLVGANIVWSTHSTPAQRLVRIFYNDASGRGGSHLSSVVDVSLPLSVTAMVRAASTTDYVTVQVFQNAGSTASIVADSTIYGTTFWAAKV